MTIKVLPNRFLIRINKEAQHKFKYQVSSNSPIYVPLGKIYNSRNMEHGEIIQIGKGVETLFEGCKVGYTLIFHHSIEDVSKEGKGYFVYEDETYNYYVCPFEFAKGYYDGYKITPTNGYVFLKNISAFPPKGEVDELSGRHLEKSASGILTFTEWKETPEEVVQKIEKIKQRIISLSKSNRTPAIQNELNRLDAETQRLNREAQKKAILPYRMAASNKTINDFAGFKVKENYIVYCFNKECLYISNFKDKEYSYIICRTEGVNGIAEPVKKHVPTPVEHY